jgi:hypothetical protein
MGIEERVWGPGAGPKLEGERAGGVSRHYVEILRYGSNCSAILAGCQRWLATELAVGPQGRRLVDQGLRSRIACARRLDRILRERSTGRMERPGRTAGLAE